MDSIKERYYKAGAALGAGVGTLALAAPVALAEGETTGVAEGVQTAITNMGTTVATEGQTTITNLLPVMAPLIATMIVIGIGLKVIMKLRGR